MNFRDEIRRESTANTGDRTRPSRRAFLGAGAGLIVAGCGTWPPRPVARPLPTSRAAEAAASPGHRILLAVMLLEYRYDELPLVEQAWRESDQQAIGVNVRRRLDLNGMRAAVLTSSLPAGLERLLGTQLPVVADALPDLVEAHRDPDLPGRSRITGMLMQFHPGQMREIPVSGLHDQVQWSTGDGERTTQGMASACRACFQVNPVQVSGIAVQLAVTPGFRESGARPTFTPGARDFQIDQEPRFHPLPGLELSATLRRNETLLIGPTGQSDQLGQLFFGDPDKEIWSDAYLRRLFLVRPVTLPGG